MTSTVDGATEVRPFRIEVPEADLAELRRRIAATRWPSKELVEDRSQGVQSAMIQELVRYWVAFTTFPGEIWAAPRSRVETVYPNLTYFNEVDRGGHFAAWEAPLLFTEEIRAAFRSLR